MVKLLGPRNPVIRFLTRVCDLMILNIILTVLCITVVLSGTAITSLYTLTLKMVRGKEGEITKTYFRALRENFTPSVPATVLLFADVTLLAFLRYALYADVLLISPYVFILLCIAALLLTAWLAWLFPLLARFDNSFRAHAGNAARLALAHLPVTFLLTLIDLAPLLSVMALPRAIGELAAFWTLFGIAAGAYVNSFYLRRVFDGE